MAAEKSQAGCPQELCVRRGAAAVSAPCTSLAATGNRTLLVKIFCCCFLLGRAAEAAPAATATKQPLLPVSREAGGERTTAPAPQGWQRRFQPCAAQATHGRRHLARQ